MIFVAVGTQKFPFNRLLKGIDDLIEQGRLEGDIFAQIGHSDYVPRNYKYKDFLSKDDFQSCIRDCEVLITHSGVATIIAGMKMEKPVVVVPRFARYAEHVDDHQLQIAESFSDKNLVLMCKNVDNLGELVEEAKKHTFCQYVSRKERIISTIRDYLETI
jgi:UDP-N-acetylglucosamine transferase subunit ALG13